jgi:tetratricopeptide (TPR) repeat protein
MLNKERQEQIDQYFNNEMTEAEKLAFEKLLETDKNLAQTLRLYQDMAVQLTNAEANLDLNQKLKAAQKSYQTTNKPPRNYLKIGLILLVVLSILSIAWWLSSSQNAANTNTEIPIASLWNDTEMPSANIIRSPDAIPNDIRLYQSAHAFFVKKQFNDAINLLDSIQEESNIYSKMVLLKGVCKYELGQYQEAIDIYTAYLAILNKPQDMALWYQAIAYAKNEDKANAMKNLNIIIEERYSKADEAKILLEQLK